nr:16S rRNA (adenine(1518)-N(6)/adenine(1519)-N(6))-dimethyltransferase RsmA [Acidimicrobiia bacterium]
WLWGWLMAQGRGEVRRLLSRHGIRPIKRYGQNFLGDPNLVDRIVRTADVGAGDRVVEVGAGTGTLTRALAAAGAEVVAYEVDERLRPLLAEVLQDTNTVLRFEDVTKVDLSKSLSGGPWIMVANLPYNIGTPLILDVLRNVPAISRLVVMVQREVADRLTAGPGKRAYGLPSVVVGVYAEATLAFTVPADVFYPKPEVESAVVLIDRKPAPENAPHAIELAAAAFRQRRKMVRRSLEGVVADLPEALAAAGLPETARPEDIDVAGFLRLAALVTDEPRSHDQP